MLKDDFSNTSFGSFRLYVVFGSQLTCSYKSSKTTWLLNHVQWDMYNVKFDCKFF